MTVCAPYTPYLSTCFFLLSGQTTPWQLCAIDFEDLLLSQLNTMRSILVISAARSNSLQDRSSWGNSRKRIFERIVNWRASGLSSECLPWFCRPTCTASCRAFLQTPKKLHTFTKNDAQLFDPIQESAVLWANHKPAMEITEMYSAGIDSRMSLKCRYFFLRLRCSFLTQIAREYTEP